MNIPTSLTRFLKLIRETDNAHFVIIERCGSLHSCTVLHARLTNATLNIGIHSARLLLLALLLVGPPSFLQTPRANSLPVDDSDSTVCNHNIEDFSRTLCILQ